MTTRLTHHGGRLSDARAQFGGEAADWLDLSTGINPRGWSPPATLAIEWRSLPDPAELAHLEHVAARYFEADPALCMAVPGSEIALRALGSILRLPGRHAPLCYGTHIDAFPPTNARGEDGPSVLVLGNPNNPDGAILSQRDVLDALEWQERERGWLIVDEAFADCTPQASVANMVASDRRLIVTRSFGKFFGLAGVRLGFVLAPCALLAQLRQLLGEWPVSAAGLTLGTSAYADAAWIEAARRDLARSSARLDAILRRHGLAQQGGCPLFRLVYTDRAQQVFTALAHRHILTRPFSAHPRLLRFGLPGDDAGFHRLDTGLAGALAND